MASWLFVLGERDAIPGVVDRRTMAFREHIPASNIAVGDGFAMYVTRGAFHNPTVDEARVFAVGVVASPVSRRGFTVAGERFPQSVQLRFVRKPLPPRSGMPFRPLVSRLRFIQKKRSWHAYVRKALVALPDSDLALIDARLRKYEQQLRQRR